MRLVDSIRQTSALCVEAARTRAALFAHECRIELARAQSSLLLLAAAVICLIVALCLFSLLLVVVFWDTHRIAAIGSGCLVASATAAALAWASRRRLAALPRPFAATLHELAADADALRGKS